MMQCLWPQCSRLSEMRQWCNKHWPMIPQPLRDDLARSRQHGRNAVEYITAMNAIREWIWSNAT